MKARALLIGGAIGAGAFLALSGQGKRLIDQVNARMRQRRAKEQLTPAQTIQDERATEEVADMLDEVVHRDDIPDTEVKHAFEQAVHDQVQRK